MRLGWIAIALTLFAGAAVADGLVLEGKPKPAMLLLSARNDGGWTQAFDEARAKIETATGLKIPFVENVPEDAAQIRPAAEKFIQRGFNVIIGTAFGYSDTMKELAAKYPHVAFLNGAGTTNGSNLESFYGRTYESQYLCGMVAGAVSKSGKLGFVAAHPFGLVNWTINAWELGARKMNPNATVTVVFTGSWNDPLKERAAAQALADQGVDVIGQHVDTPTPQLVAQERGLYGTGHHRDMREFAPKATVCSSVWTWEKFLTPELQTLQAGNWTPGAYGAFPGIAKGGTDIACCGPAVPADAVAKVMAERAAIIAGKHVFAGPLADRDGRERVAAGAVPGDGDLWKMDWYVKGVTAQQ